MIVMVLLLSGNKVICKGQYYDHDKTMIMIKLKSAKGKKFLLCLLAVFIVAASVVTRATIGGVIEQYHIPLSEWTSSMYAIQSAMIFVYSLVFTILLAIPLGIYFLGGDE